MRKILSVFLTAAMLLSLIAVIPFGASAELAQPNVVTFDTMAEQSYYAGSTASSAKLEYSNDPAQGAAIRLGSIVRESNSTWIQAVKIAQFDSTGAVAAYKLTAGLNYTINFKYKADNVDMGTDSGTKLGLRLFHVSQYQNMSNFIQQSGKAPTAWANLYVGDISSNTNGWVNHSYTFTAPADIAETGMDELALSATYNYLGPWKASDQQLWIDDISIDLADPGVESYLTTFDTDADVDFNTNVSRGNSGVVDTGDATQKNAVNLKTFPSKNSTNTWGCSVRIAGVKDGAVTSFKVVPGASYNLSFKYYNNSAITYEGEAITSLNFLLMHVSNLNSGYFLGSKTAPQDWAHIDLGSADFSTLNTWLTFKQTITIPATIGSSDELVLMPVSNRWKATGDMYIDDIKITRNVTGSAYSTDVSFDEADYYDAANDNGNYQYAELVDTGDAARGKAIKFTSFYRSDQKWPQTVRLVDSSDNSPFNIKLNGRKYEISFDIKKEIAANNFYIAAHFAIPGGGIGAIGTVDAGQYAPAKLKFAWTEKGTSDWERVTYTITTPEQAPSGYDYSNLILTCYNADSSWSSVTNQSVLIDNVTVKALTKVTVHNGATDTEEKWFYPETELANVTTNLPGAKVKSWYYDADLTKPAYDKYVGYYDKELWAANESVVIDFEDDTPYYINNWEDPTFNVVEYDGIYNSKGLSNAKANGSINSNAAWPDSFRLAYADGTPLKTLAGHTYRLAVQVKAVPTLIADHATLYLAHKGYNFGNEGPSPFTYPLINNEYYSETGLPMKTAFRNTDGVTYDDTAKWHQFVFEFEGLEDGLSVWMIPWQVNGCSVTIDNIVITDVTAQKTVTDEAGNELAKGYLGEDVVISAPADNGDTNFINYADANGNVVTEMTIKADTQLTAVKSQIAVTAAEADLDKDMVSFKVRYEGLTYENVADSTDIKVKKIVVGNKRYDIDEIGMLVLPKANATEALSLENYETLGAIKVSNGDLKYTVTADGSVTAKAGIITDKFDRDYTVVGFVKYAGKVLYSQTRLGIAESLNAAANIETVDAAAYTHGDYRLVDNAEFNTNGAVSNDDFGFWLNSNEVDGVTRYSTENNASVKDGNMVLTDNVTSDTEMNIAYMLGKRRFKHGYIEVKAKYDAATSGCIWLNFPGIPQSEYVYPITETDIYVNAEIDIAEFGNTDSFFATLHSWGTKDGEFGQTGQIRLNDVNGNSEGTVCNLSEWHVFGFERTSNYMRIYVDGVLTYEYTLEQAIAQCCKGSGNKLRPDYNWQYRTENEVKALFDNPTYLILSNTPNNPVNGQVTNSYIDYVRYYE